MLRHHAVLQQRVGPELRWPGTTVVWSLWLVVALAGLAEAQTTMWAPIDLGTLGGTSADTSTANGINNRGDVVGSSTINGETRAFLWTAADGMRDLGTLGGPSSTARSINDARQVVGASDVWPDVHHAFVWTDAGGMVDLGTLGGATSDAFAINNLGQVVGTSLVATGERHPFLWTEATGMTDLASALGDTAAPMGINDAGQIVGNSRAFSWTPSGGLVLLPRALSALGVNNAGAVTGSYSHPQFLYPWVYIWTAAGGISDFSPRGGDAEGMGINDAGEIVAKPIGGPPTGFVFAATGFFVLPAFPGAPPFSPRFGSAISNAGVAGYAGPHAVFWCKPGAPTITGASVTPAVLSPPDGRLVQVHVGYDVTTACLRTYTASLSVSNDEALDPSDVVVVDEHTVQLRAARTDGGDGRTYTIQIRAVDAEGLEATQTVTVTVPLESGPMTNVTLTADLQSPQPLGTTIELAAAGAGGTTPYAYRFWVQPWGGAWQIVRDWGPAATYAWTPTLASGFNVAVEAHGSGATVSEVQTAVNFVMTAGPMTGVSLMTNLANPQPTGTAIELAAAGAGGTTPYAYRFWVQPWGGAWQIVRDWGPAATYAWTPTMASGFNVAVEAHGSGATVSEVQTAVNFVITAGMTGVSLMTNLASPQPTGTMITLTATGSGGATPYAYRFWVQPWGGAWQIVRDWGPEATYVWTAAAVGGHNLAVEALSAGATAGEVQSAIGFVIAPAP